MSSNRLWRICKNHHSIKFNVIKLSSVVDSVVSQFTATELVYKIVRYQALAKKWFARKKVILNFT